MRRLALSGHQRGMRDHGGRVRGDQGAGHRPVRKAVPGGRVLGPGLRLPPPGRERRSAAPGGAGPGAARGLAGCDRVRGRAGGGRPGPARDLGLFGLGRVRLPLAARDPRLAAAIAQTPNADNPAAARNAARHQKPLAMLRFTGLAVLDALGSLAGRPPRLVPLGGPPGTVALLTTPDAADSGAALNPGGRYPDWRQEVAARSALRLTVCRPGRLASRVRCPLLVVVCDQDQSALAEPAVRAAQAGARGRARPAARRALRAVPGRARAGRRGRGVLPAPAPADAGRPRDRPSRRPA